MINNGECRNSLLLKMHKISQDFDPYLNISLIPPPLGLQKRGEKRD